MTFDEVTRTTGATWIAPEGWRQGRGAFGGLTLATLARAASESRDATERPLRTLTAEIPAAVLAGPATVHVATLRAGTGLGTIAASLEQNGETVAHAVMSFGKTRVADLERVDVEAPSPPPWTSVPPASLGPLGPEFGQHVEYRPTRGTPFAGEADARTEGWIRLLEPGEAPRAIALVALVDAWFPSVLPIVTAPRPFATISFAAHFFDRAWSLDEPLFHRSRLVGSQQGYFAELRELFTPRGELCAVNQQTMAIVR